MPRALEGYFQGRVWKEDEGKRGKKDYSQNLWFSMGETKSGVGWACFLALGVSNLVGS